MRLIPCPWCGPRDEAEYRYGGEAHVSGAAEADARAGAAWADYLDRSAGPGGLVAERWRHDSGCRRWFNVLRSADSRRILAVAKLGEPPATVGEFGGDP